MRRFLAPLALLFAAGAACADTGDWHPSLDAGLKAAEKSGKPILVVTAWRDGQ